MSALRGFTKYSMSTEKPSLFQVGYLLRDRLSMKKKDDLLSIFTEYFCVLASDGRLMCFSSEEDSRVLGQEIHVIDIEDQVARCIVQPNGFVLVDPHHIWEFAIEGDASKWTEQIAKFIYLDKSIQVRCTGTMVKQGGYFATWKERYFICSAKYLFYFKSQSDADHFTAFASETLDRLPKKLSESAQGWISLPNTTVTELGDFEKYSNTFAIAPAPGSDARMYRISAQDPDQMHLFVKHCREAAANMMVNNTTPAVQE